MAKKQQGKKTGASAYRVSGVQALIIEGKRLEPGDEFEALLAPEYESQMIMGGHLEVTRQGSLTAEQADNLEEPPE